jgi:hypothetical protein
MQSAALGAQRLAGLQGPAGQQDAAGAGRLQLLQVHYAAVQLWRGEVYKRLPQPRVIL